MESKVQTYAKSHGYDYAKKLDLIWDGKEIYVLKFQTQDGEKTRRGWPQYLLIQNNVITRATHEQAVAITMAYSRK